MTGGAETPYDPALRRDTPLALKLRARICRDGPIPVSAYMDACLNDPEHGYYRTRNAIGRGGDFITAPEISQTFGELIGLWSAVVWQQMGSPSPFNLIELGAGRGTMMADALRALRAVPACGEAARVVLVEPNPVLRDIQRTRLAAARTVTWSDHVTEVPLGPAILLANEILDVLPVAQFVRGDIGWRERGVGLDASGLLCFAELENRPRLMLPEMSARASPGTIIERRKIMAETFALNRLASAGPIAALFIDYGHESTEAGDTLQAVRNHRHEHPLTSPGEADLTAHVDFASLAREAGTWNLAIDGPVTQAQFLGTLGIAERASRLMAANPAKAAEIEAGVARLMSPNGMGGRFKAIGIRSAHLSPLPGFPAVDKSPASAE